MKHRIRNTLRYVANIIEEITEELDKGQIKEREAILRMFCLGKVLMGWDDNKTKFEQIGFLMNMNDKVMCMRKGMSRREQMRS